MGMKVNGAIKTILTLLILSLVVGLILATLGLRPLELVSAVGSAASDVIQIIERLIHWAWRYVLLGAVIVVPAWILLYLLRRLRRR